MKKGWLLAISLALVATLVGLVGCTTNGGGIPSGFSVDLNSQQEGIWVTGRGEVIITPDIATLSLGVEAQAVSVAQAQTEAIEAMDGVMIVLNDMGVEKKDIQTQYFSIQQVTRWDGTNQEEIVIGYRVTNLVMTKIRDIDEVGAIIDAVAEAGGDLVRINNISFSVDDPSVYYEEAREKAMTDAKAKAEQLAELSKVNLGKPTYISESFQVPPPIYPMVREAAAAPAPETPISPGQIEIVLTVQVAYAILG